MNMKDAGNIRRPVLWQRVRDSGGPPCGGEPRTALSLKEHLIDLIRGKERGLLMYGDHRVKHSKGCTDEKGEPCFLGALGW